ncbi:MAG TPA: radical SAM family heme chaperone HemW [Nitrospiraceae bacterium]|nr:radical SAM family heme chaperone HemW [Nitrospiraceae bacterium]
MGLGLYIHVPFCRTRCHFCAFYLQIYRPDKGQAYVRALAREIALHAELNTLTGRPLDTVYFGGGTPTVVPPADLISILATVRDLFSLRPHAEITLEAHPDSVTAEGLDLYLRAGFNRISFGAQSMDGAELVRVGRPTSPDRTRTAVTLARRAGFTNINLDVIYGLPGQTLDSWRSTLDQTIALGPAHLSCYAMTVEDDTRLHRTVERGEWETDTDLQLAMEREIARQSVAAGFQRYEVSNFCRPGYGCRHNLLYWTDGEYLGIGPSAQSYLDGRRFGTLEDLVIYQDRLMAGRMPVAYTEHLTAEQRRREAVVFGLRLTGGVDAAMVAGAAAGPGTLWSQSLERMIRDGLVEHCADRIRLTEVGRRFADTVAVALL